MKNRVSLLFAALFCTAGYASATVINPLPSDFGPDDGTELFHPMSDVLSVEFFDLVGSLGGPSTFGFFFEFAPANLIPIFEPSDQGGTQAALIDFANGVVFDVDEGGTVQSTFTGNGNIGFFLSLEPDAPIVLFTVSAFNAGLDLAATFPSFASSDTYLLGFELPPLPTSSDQTGQTIAYELVSGTKPVPEPGTAFLIGLLLAGAGVRLRSRKA